MRKKSTLNSKFWYNPQKHKLKLQKKFEGVLLGQWEADQDVKEMGHVEILEDEEDEEQDDEDGEDLDIDELKLEEDPR